MILMKQKYLNICKKEGILLNRAFGGDEQDAPPFLVEIGKIEKEGMPGV
jgi:hypothetical protein